MLQLRNFLRSKVFGHVMTVVATPDVGTIRRPRGASYYRWTRHANTIWIPVDVSHGTYEEISFLRVCHDQLVYTRRALRYGAPLLRYRDAVSRYFIVYRYTASSKDATGNRCTDVCIVFIPRVTRFLAVAPPRMNTCSAILILSACGYMCFRNIDLKFDELEHIK